MTIRVGIMGYGNLGRGVELALRHNPDMELKAVFTRRNPESSIPCFTALILFSGGPFVQKFCSQTSSTAHAKS